MARLILLLSLLLLAGQAQALELRTLSGRAVQEPALVFAEGPIMPGDGARLRDLLRASQAQHVVLILHSMGGSVNAAAEIADLVARLRITVAIPRGGVCASACVLVLAASPERVVADSARIGVHSASQNRVETAGAMAVTTALAREMHRYGVPEQVIGSMVTTPADQIAWLGEAERRAMAFASWEARAAAPLPRPSWLGVALPPLMPMPDAATTPTGATPAALPPGLSPADIIGAGEPLAFREGLADRTRWEDWLAAAPRDLRIGAEYWAVRRDLPGQGECGIRGAVQDPPGSRYVLQGRAGERLLILDREAAETQLEVDAAEFRAGCNTARQRLTTIDMRRRSEADYRRGWQSYLPRAYRQDVLERMMACRISGGRPVRAANLETRHDINGDGRLDYVIDLSALRCQRRQAISASDHCGQGGCALHVYLSMPAGGHGPAVALVAHRWAVREDTPGTLLLFGRGCAEEVCAQRYAWNGKAFAPVAH